MATPKQIRITGEELWAKVPDGDLPDTITVDGIKFTVEQIDAIFRTIQSHLTLTIQRLRNGRLAVRPEGTEMPVGVWSVYEPDGSFFLRPAPLLPR
jgi:hypothetical protein